MARPDYDLAGVISSIIADRSRREVGRRRNECVSACWLNHRTPYFHLSLQAAWSPHERGQHLRGPRGMTAARRSGQRMSRHLTLTGASESRDLLNRINPRVGSVHNDCPAQASRKHNRPHELGDRLNPCSLFQYPAPASGFPMYLLSLTHGLRRLCVPFSCSHIHQFFHLKVHQIGCLLPPIPPTEGFVRLINSKGLCPDLVSSTSAELCSVHAACSVGSLEVVAGELIDANTAKFTLPPLSMDTRGKACVCDGGGVSETSRDTADTQLSQQRKQFLC